MSTDEPTICVECNRSLHRAYIGVDEIGLFIECPYCGRRQYPGRILVMLG